MCTSRSASTFTFLPAASAASVFGVAPLPCEMRNRSAASRMIMMSSTSAPASFTSPPRRAVPGFSFVTSMVTRRSMTASASGPVTLTMFSADTSYSPARVRVATTSSCGQLL